MLLRNNLPVTGRVFEPGTVHREQAAAFRHLTHEGDRSKCLQAGLVVHANELEGNFLTPRTDGLLYFAVTSFAEERDQFVAENRGAIELETGAAVLLAVAISVGGGILLARRGVVYTKANSHNGS